MPVPAVRQRFRRRLLGWYDRHGRDLPWRKTGDPYHILVSEIMLQQTQVDRVKPKYEEWLTKYPSLEALAVAPEQEVVDAWYPLGYNIRPRRLHAIARETVANYGGALPDDAETLRSFKGIGEYTAGAIQSFAFGQRAAILDTNVARVLFRVFIGRGNPKAGAMRRRLWSLSRTLVPMRRVFDFNQALMDLGAMVCTARQPKCLVCPMTRLCKAYPFNPDGEVRKSEGKSGREVRQRSRKDMSGKEVGKGRRVVVAAAVVEKDGRFLVTKRLAGTHLAGYWEFPGGKCLADESPQACLVREIREELDAEIVIGVELLETIYTYPEKTVALKFFQSVLSTEPRAALGQQMQWVSRDELMRLEFPPADKELIELLIRHAR